MRRLLRRAWFLLHQRRLEADLAEELAFHEEMKRRELEASGARASNALHATKRALGSIALAQDQARDVWLPRWLQGIGQDLRLAVRTLRATPIVTAVAVLSLALGIGANTALFSIVNGLLLRALPVTDPQRLVALSSGPGAEHTYSYATFDQIRQQARAFDGALAVAGPSELAYGYPSETVSALWVSGDFFDTLGIRAIRGRMFTAMDDLVGGGPDGPAAVISYGFWQQRLGGAADIVGRSVLLERTRVRVVGIAPPDFFGVEVGQTFDLFLPIRTEPLVRPAIPYDDDTVWVRMMLRLKPDQSINSATIALRGVQAQIRAAAAPRAYVFGFGKPVPGSTEFLKAPFWLEVASTGTSELRQRFRQPLVALLALIGLVLMMACANIANLQTARAAARQVELSVRVALGASRWRLARQLLLESLVLGTMGAGLGLVWAPWASHTLVAQLSTSLSPVFVDVSIDGRVLAFTVAILFGTTLMFGTRPAWRATRVPPIDAMRRHVYASAVSRHAPLSSGLVVAQVAVSLMIIVAAGLLGQMFARLSHARLGFEADRLLSVMVTAPTVAAADRNPFYHRLVSAAAGAPGVAHAGGSRNPPLTQFYEPQRIAVTSTTGELPRAVELDAIFVDITPGWLATYGLPIRAGRDIDAHDTLKTSAVMLVNEAFTRRFASDQNLVGSTVTLLVRDVYGNTLPMTRTIVGVTGDAVYGALRQPIPPTIYYPLAQVDGPIGLAYFFIAMRSISGSPETWAGGVTAALTAVNPNVRLRFLPVVTQVRDALAQDRVVATLASFFAGLALLLAALGLYGVTAYAVARQRSEIGIRMALGATPLAVVRLALSRVATLVALGIAVGTVASLCLSRFVAVLLYGVAPRDPATLAGAIVVLVSVAALAAWFPARRASRIDPAAVLRDQ
jgi:predicted permease